MAKGCDKQNPRTKYMPTEKLGSVEPYTDWDTGCKRYDHSPNVSRFLIGLFTQTNPRMSVARI